MKNIIYFLILINTVINSQPYIFNIIGREDSSDILTINSIDYYRIKENYVQKTNAMTKANEYLFDNGDLIYEYFLCNNDSILIIQKLNDLLFYDIKNEIVILTRPVFSDCIYDIIIKNNNAYIFACSNNNDGYIDLYNLSLLNGQYNLVLSYPYGNYFHGVSASSNFDSLYFEYEDTTYIPLQDDKIRYIIFSTVSNSIVTTGLVASLGSPNMDGYILHDGNNGKCIVESINLGAVNERNFRLYNFNNSTGSNFISYQGDVKPFLLSQDKYLILASFVDSNAIKFNTGLFEIFDINTTTLIKTVHLPEGGDINMFGSFPNNLYYVKDIELPTRQIFTLKMDSLLNVLDLTSLSPSSKIVNSPPFTLTVNGHGFDTLSTVYLNGGAKSTTFINDSVLTASIVTSDISVVGNYPVWVTDEWGTSDTLMFAVTPVPPDINKISPSLALPYDPLYELEYFTVTITGENFTTSSVAYYNGVAKTTNYISDSIVTFQLRSYDIGTTPHTKPIWVQNSTAISDTIIFSVVISLPQQIIPVLQCVRTNNRTSFTAYFGYNNLNNEGIFIPAGGSRNLFSPFPQYQGQPNIFLPGSQTNAFNVNFNGDLITWTLNGANVSASKKSPACP
ncbi:MAG: hypothetical protein WAU11_08335 [Ignavibacteriaceae bacterium]